MTELGVVRGRVETFSKILTEIPEVRYIGDPVLRSAAQAVEFEEGLEIGKRLGEIIIRYRGIAGYGRGFAAPQMGLENQSL